ncbi:DUF2889 domain-containing protein [Spongiibacter tropicus]|uniref:DUF2889 domain-containing protein n=1 Tax=Spongiibacter tropicus TaxID=454602 RepID=UPI0003B69999|nr:DUF2889 domain-containing protein [Spongiibacter tropicus]
MRPPQEVLPPNPDYGRGVFRRRIALHRSEQRVEVELEDCSHAMRVCLTHNGEVITTVQGDVLRAPVNTCPSAPQALSEFVGKALHSDPGFFVKQVDARAQCTHLHDMTSLAAAQALCGAAQTQLDITVADERDGIIEAEIAVNGRLVHYWQVRGRHIEQPAALQGRPLYKGFIAWVLTQFEGQAQVCALALQRGVMVANARRWDMRAAYGQPADDFGPGKNVCYSYSEPRIHSARRNENSVRDFTHTPEELLRFR